MAHRQFTEGYIQGQQDLQSLERYLQIDIGRLLYWLRNKAVWIAGAALVGVLLAVAYVSLAPHRYTVTSEILVDPTGLQVVADDLYGRTDQRDAQLMSVDSKLQTLLSRNVLARVIDRLDLTSDTEFVPSTVSLGSDRRGSVDPKIVALDALSSRVTARRDERSYVITLSVSTRDADKSVLISESIIEEFKAELIAADSEGASRIAGTLVARLAELRASVSEAEEAMEIFRRQNGLRVSNGELVSSRSMSQVDTQLREARERFIAADSRHAALVTGDGGSEATQSSTLSALRTQYATLKQQSDAQSAILGPRHPRRQVLDLELRSLQTEINAEVHRLRLAAQNELEQARSVVTALEAEATTISTDVFSDNEAQIRLRELTREVAARTTIYENFLARSRVASERQELDSTNVRVISLPVKPRYRSWPPSLKQAGIFGALSGFTLGGMGVLAFGIAADMKKVPVRGRPKRPNPLQRSPAQPKSQPQPKPARPAAAGSLLNAAPRTTPAQNVPHGPRGRLARGDLPYDPYGARR